MLSGVTIAGFRSALLLISLALSCPAAATEPLAVQLDLQEPGGVARHEFPASASVPLPRGRLRAPGGLWVEAADGKAVPSQTRALERWPDGSVRWLLVDFLADVPVALRTTYRLRDGRAPAASGPRVRVTTQRGARVVDTGRLRFVVPDAGDALATDVTAGTARVRTLAAPTLTVDGAGPLRAGDAKVTVETSGPVRTEILLSGRYPNGLAWEARVAAFAGQRWLRIQHTVTNLADAHYMPIRSLPLVAPGRFTQGVFGIDGGIRPVPDLEQPHVVAHRDAQPALLDGASVGRHGDGWARAADDQTVVTVVGAAFWQEWPKALRVAADGVSLDLFAGSEEPVLLGTGAAKTHELWVAVEPAEGAEPPDTLAAALRAPLVALPRAQWIVASHALPQALAPDGPGSRDFLARLSDAFSAYRRGATTERWDEGPPVPCAERTSEHPRVGLYGLLNWGDWQFPGYRDHVRGCDGWGNLEYDLTQALALAWAATGSRDFYDGLVPAARHYRDIDIIHHWPEHPEFVGLNHPHKVLHFALESPETVDLGHTWTEGLVSYWRLTGETRTLAAARGIADALVRRVDVAHNPRQFGWPMIALAAVYDATGERRYLDAARAYATRATTLYRGTPAAGDWKMGILADGVAAVHAASRDPNLRSWLVSYGDALLADPVRFADPRFALPLGYLAALTGNSAYRTAALTAARDLKIGRWGKTLAWSARVGFRLLGPLQDESRGSGLPVTKPSAPARPTRPAPRAGGSPGHGAPTPSRSSARSPSPSR